LGGFTVPNQECVAVGDIRNIGGEITGTIPRFAVVVLLSAELVLIPDSEGKQMAENTSRCPSAHTPFLGIVGLQLVEALEEVAILQG